MIVVESWCSVVVTIICSFALSVAKFAVDERGAAGEQSQRLTTISGRVPSSGWVMLHERFQ